MCRRRNYYNSGAVFAAPVMGPPNGQVQFQGQQTNYVLVDAPFGYGYSCTCGRRKCRCYRRGGYPRRQRGAGPIGLLIGGIVSLVNNHQQHKQQEREQQQRTIAAQESARQREKEIQIGTTARTEEEEEALDDARTEYEDYDEVAAREWEQHQQTLEQQRRRDEKHWESGPPPYKA